jgi:hypothetical protein
MSKISIKIVEVDQATQTALVKYSSEHSLKPIDEYPAIAFQISNFNVKTPEEFVEAIRPQITQYVQQRDAAENPDNIDISSWHGHSVEVEAHVVEPTLISTAVPVLPTQQIPAQISPEVIL